MLASRASLPEELTLRSLMGLLVGERLFTGFGRVAIVTFPDGICSALSASIATGFLARTGYRERAVSILVYEEGRLDEMARRVLSFSPDVVFIGFGGSTGSARRRTPRRRPSRPS